MTLALQNDLVDIRVNLGERSYSILISPGLIEKSGELFESNLPNVSKYAIVTDEIVRGLHADDMKKKLEERGIKAKLIQVPQGEETKSWDQAGELVGRLIDAGLDRRSVVVALGGGVVGDLAGFAAAIYLRGIRLIQVPTTLLAQVDSGIGGKTAINHPKGKNLIGAFKQPSLVLVDPNVLRTLPVEELRSGLAEVVKYAVVADARLFDSVQAGVEKLVRGDPTSMMKIIARCCEIKARLAEIDEKDERGLRAALNYGHTLGHALETLTDLTLRHGEAVAVGMTFAVKISLSQGLMSLEELERQRALLKRIGLQTKLPELDIHELIEVMRRDKKSEEGHIRFVLPTGIGKPPVLRSIPDEVILKTLEEWRRDEA